jgi:hypothetical protein
VIGKLIGEGFMPRALHQTRPHHTLHNAIDRFKVYYLKKARSALPRLFPGVFSVR